MKKRKVIELSQSERKELEQFSKTGNHSVRLVNRAKIIELDESEGRKKGTQAVIADRVGVSRQYPTNCDTLRCGGILTNMCM